MGVGSQFLSLTAGFGEGLGKRPKSSEKQEARLFRVVLLEAAVFVLAARAAMARLVASRSSDRLCSHRTSVLQPYVFDRATRFLCADSPCSGDPHVLRTQSLVAAAGIEDDRLALAQLLEHRAVPDGAPMHEIFLAVLALNKPEALIRNHF